MCRHRQTTLENSKAQFGPKGAKRQIKAFDVVAGEAVTNMVKKFDKDKAKAHWKLGLGAEGQTIKFAASSDRGQCVAHYLDAMLKAGERFECTFSTNVIQNCEEL